LDGNASVDVACLIEMLNLEVPNLEGCLFVSSLALNFAGLELGDAS
jgi:hypothetical protein